MDKNQLFGKLAVKQGYLTVRQYKAALAWVARVPELTIPQVCIKKGWMQLAQVQKIRQQLLRHHRSGRLARQAGSGTAAFLSQADFFGSYRLLKELGRGGMGIVFKAVQPQTQRVVALKIMRTFDQSSMDHTLVQRFAKEIKITSRLQHPNIITVYDAGQEHGTLYFAMQYVDGVTLDSFVQQEACDFTILARMFVKICDALEYAHNQDVIHRDLKLSNILVDRHLEPYVNDFGLSKDLNSQTCLTQQDDVLGTPYFIAPELISEGASQASRQTDIYSLGVMLYKSLTGHYPFENKSFIELCRDILSASVIPPRQFNPTLPEPLETIILTAMARDLGERYATCEQMKADLQNWLQRPNYWLTQHSQRQWLSLALKCTLVMIVVLVVILLFLLWQRLG